MDNYSITDYKLLGSMSIVKSSLFDIISDLNKKIMTLENINDNDPTINQLINELKIRLKNIIEISNSFSNEIVSIDVNYNTLKELITVDLDAIDDSLNEEASNQDNVVEDNEKPEEVNDNEAKQENSEEKVEISEEVEQENSEEKEEISKEEPVIEDDTKKNDSSEEDEEVVDLFADHDEDKSEDSDKTNEEEKKEETPVIVPEEESDDDTVELSDKVLDDMMKESDEENMVSVNLDEKEETETVEEKSSEEPVIEEEKKEEAEIIEEKPSEESETLEEKNIDSTEEAINQQKEKVTNKVISYIINKDTIDPAKAILVTSLQYEKLLLSRDEQKTLCKLRKYMVMPGEKEEPVDLEKMLQEAERLYKEGNTVAAEELYNKISELNK